MTNDWWLRSAEISRDHNVHSTSRRVGRRTAGTLSIGAQGLGRRALHFRGEGGPQEQAGAPRAAGLSALAGLCRGTGGQELPRLQRQPPLDRSYLRRVRRDRGRLSIPARVTYDGGHFLLQSDWEARLQRLDLLAYLEAAARQGQRTVGRRDRLAHAAQGAAGMSRSRCPHNALGEVHL